MMAPFGVSCFAVGMFIALSAGGYSEDLRVGPSSIPPNATDQRIQRAQVNARKAPANYAAFDALGSAYFQKARETGDIANFELAEQALTRSVELCPRGFAEADPLVDLAMVYMGEHRFADALKNTQKAIALGSGNIAAFAIEGDALTDQGRYDEAAAAYGTARALGGSFESPLALAYMLDSRMAYLSFIQGDSEKAIELMNSAISAGMRTNVPRENIAWLYFELGERYFQFGDLIGADLAYRQGIAADPQSYRCLAGLAKVRAAQEKWPESVELYQRSIEIVPFPQYVEELGDVYSRSGKPKEAQRQYDLVDYIGHLSKLQQVLANREFAVFDADHNRKPDEALRLARKELELRQDVYTWDALGWVLLKSGHVLEAREAANKALLFHTKDPLLLFHAGLIANAAGDRSAARDYLAEALKLNPHFHILHASVAVKTLASLQQFPGDNRSPETDEPHKKAVQ